MKNLIIALLACFMVLMGCKQKNNRETGVDSQPEYSEQLPPPSANSQSEIKIIPIEHDYRDADFVLQQINDMVTN